MDFILHNISISNNSFFIDPSHSFIIGDILYEGTQGTLFHLTNIHNPSHKLILKKIHKQTHLTNFHNINDTQILISFIASNLLISPKLHFVFTSSELFHDQSHEFYFLIFDRYDMNLYDFIFSYEKDFNKNFDKSPSQIINYLQSIISQFHISEQLYHILITSFLQGHFVKNDNLLNNFVIDLSNYTIYGIDYDMSYFYNSNICSYEFEHHKYLFYELQTIDDDISLRIPTNIHTNEFILKLLQ